MAAADLEVRADGELERIESWRAEELRRAGYDADQVAAADEMLAESGEDPR